MRFYFALLLFHCVLSIASEQANLAHFGFGFFSAFFPKFVSFSVSLNLPLKKRSERASVAGTFLRLNEEEDHVCYDRHILYMRHELQLKITCFERLLDVWFIFFLVGNLRGSCDCTGRHSHDEYLTEAERVCK